LCHCIQAIGVIDYFVTALMAVGLTKILDIIKIILKDFEIIYHSIHNQSGMSIKPSLIMMDRRGSEGR